MGLFRSTGKIAFSSDRDGDHEICVIDAQGCDLDSTVSVPLVEGEADRH